MTALTQAQPAATPGAAGPEAGQPPSGAPPTGLTDSMSLTMTGELRPPGLRGTRPLTEPVGMPGRGRPGPDNGTTAIVPADANAGRTDQPVAAGATALRSSVTSVIAVAGIDGATLWAENGQDILRSLPVGQRMVATSRTADEAWLWTTVDDAEGWVRAAEVIAFNLERLPLSTRTTPVSLPTLPATTTGTVAVTSTAAPATGEEDATGAVITASAAAAAVSNLVPISQPAAASAVTAIVNVDRLNVRSGPGTGVYDPGQGADRRQPHTLRAQQ